MQGCCCRETESRKAALVTTLGFEGGAEDDFVFSRVIGVFGCIKNNQPHGAKSCPFIASNLRKVIGNTALIRSEEKYYNLAFQYESSDKEKRCKRNDSSTLEPCLYKFLPHCPPMNMCQSLNEWKFQMLTSKINRMFARKSLKMPEHVLYFLPIGPFPEFIRDYKDHFLNRSLFQLMGDFIRAFFPGSTVHHLPEFDISEISPRSRNHSLTGKLQYLVSDILNFLRKKLPPDGFAIIGLSWYDMYPCEDMNFILGQGSSQHSACVSSFGRFDPNYVKGFKGQKEGIRPEEMKDITEINADVLWKIMKVLSHETCHVFGLSHCTVFECLMNASSSTSQALSQPFYLCPLCMSKVQHLQTSLRTNCKPDESTVKGHFSSVLTFTKTVFTPADLTNSRKIADSITWLDSMVNYLED